MANSKHECWVFRNSIQLWVTAKCSTPIYDFLGASPDQIPILHLAGPVTGLLVQPVIGALSDKTWHPKLGRRKPYFLIGAILCSLALIAFPFSSSLWMAAGLLWILDAGNNTAWSLTERS